MPLKCGRHSFSFSRCFKFFETIGSKLFLCCGAAKPARVRRFAATRCGAMRGAALAGSLVLATLIFAGGAGAQPREIFTSVPSALSADPALAQRIDQFRRRPTTQS